ncbi:MAG: hypothetical protein WD766_05020 [Gemmatimonadota bacterium]
MRYHFEKIIGLDERGVALPLALFGLVAISLLVTSALVTSSTELALSSAHQDGTRGLYAADAALEGFVAQRAAMATDLDQRFVTGDYAIQVGVQGYQVRVAELFRSVPEQMADDSFERREIYSVVTQPENGRGRSVGAMMEVTRVANSISLSVDSGLTLGTDATITGNATVSDGSDSAICTNEDPGAAIRYSSDSEVSIGGSSNIVGDTIQDTRGREELMNYVLNGHTIDELADYAQIRFGPTYEGPDYPNGAGPIHTSSDFNLRWGCPAHLVGTCSAEQATYFPTVVIDANGTDVSISNWHGQGVLLVRNGGLDISGSFQYAGIILVEGTLQIRGGGGANRPNIEGAVIAMGDEVVIDPGDESEATGSSVVRFNQCEIANAQRGLTIQSLDTQPQIMDTPTFAWFEVVR